MTPADNSLHPVNRETRRKALITAIVLASSTVISIVFLSYALMQKAEAASLRDKVEQLKKQVEQIESLARKQAEDARDEASRQHAMMAVMNAQLIECKNSKN